MSQQDQVTKLKRELRAYKEKCEDLAIRLEDRKNEITRLEEVISAIYFLKYLKLIMPKIPILLTLTLLPFRNVPNTEVSLVMLVKW